LAATPWVNLDLPQKNQSRILNSSMTVDCSLRILPMWPCAIVLALFTASYGQTATGANEPGANEPGFAPEQFYQMPEYQVEAYGFTDQAFELPVDTVVIDAEALSRHPASNVPEVLQKEANVLITSTSGHASDAQLALRGYGENSGLRVLVLVDGVPFNRSDMGRLDWSQIPLEAVQRIEVYRGGQSVLYGDQASSGVVNIITKPTRATAARLQGLRGSDDSWQAAATVSATQGPLSISSGYHYDWDRGYRQDSLKWAKTGNGQVGYQLSEHTSLRISGSLTKSRTQFPGPLTLTEFKKNPRQGTLEGEVAEQAGRLSASVDMLGERTEVTAIVGATHRRREGGFSDNRNTMLGSRLAINGRYNWPTGFVQTGLELKRDQIDHDQFLSLSDVATANAFGLGLSRQRYTHKLSTARLTQYQQALYGFASQSIGQRLSLSGGVRGVRTHTSGTNHARSLSSLPPLQPDLAASFDQSGQDLDYAAEVAIVVAPAKNVRLWAGADRLYRTPVLDELAAYQGFALSRPFNAALGPEHGSQLEVGGKFNRGPFSSSLTGFVQWLDNEIAYDPLQRLNTNLPYQTRRHGLEWTARLDHVHWGLQGSAAWTQAHINQGPLDGERLPHVPRWTATGTAWLKPLEQLRLYAGARLVADREADDVFAQRSVENPGGYLLFDLGAQWQLNERLSLTVNVDNVANTAHVSQVFAGNYYPGRGRYMALGLSLDL
jgi:iron complex outermembrane receptor protein